MQIEFYFLSLAYVPKAISERTLIDIESAVAFNGRNLTVDKKDDTG